jgi:hypothetical protein
MAGRRQPRIASIITSPVTKEAAIIHQTAIPSTKAARMPKRLRSSVPIRVARAGGDHVLSSAPVFSTSYNRGASTDSSTSLMIMSGE